MHVAQKLLGNSEKYANTHRKSVHIGQKFQCLKCEHQVSYKSDLVMQRISRYLKWLNGTKLLGTKCRTVLNIVHIDGCSC